MRRALSIAALAMGLSGCVNLYRHVDIAPDGAPMRFRGIEDYVSDGHPLYVMQIHGMGDHSFGNDCAAGSENLVLQQAIAKRLRYVADPGYGTPDEMSIEIDGTKAGTYSVSRYIDQSGKGGALFFSCVTWGETSRIVKQGMLELKGKKLREDNENDRHRAPINRMAKGFVNVSFSDPLIYLGAMGPYIRNVVWEGIRRSTALHVQKHAQTKVATVDAQLSADQVRAFVSQSSVAVISDSLGSRIVFDVMCSKGGAQCKQGDRPEMLERAPTPQQAQLEAALVEELSGATRSIYMLANQLPLLEMAYLAPPEAGKSLQTMIDTTTKCYQPLLGFKAPPKELALAGNESDADANAGKIQVISFTDVNDALSYHLSDRFKRRCASAESDDADALEIINVTIPNAKLRWLFAYSNLVKAHSGGFKHNDRAIDYLVEGND